MTETNNNASAVVTTAADVSTSVAAKSLPATNPFTNEPENNASVEDAVDSNGMNVAKNINNNNTSNNNKNTNSNKTDAPDTTTNDNNKHEVIPFIILCSEFAKK